MSVDAEVSEEGFRSTSRETLTFFYLVAKVKGLSGPSEVNGVSWDLYKGERKGGKKTMNDQ